MLRGGDRGGGRIQERGDLRVSRALEVLLVASRETQHETRGQTGVIAAEKVLGTQKDVSHAEARGGRGVSIDRREVGIEPAAIHVEAETAVDERERHAHDEIVPQTIGHRSDDLVCEEVDGEAMDDEQRSGPRVDDRQAVVAEVVEVLPIDRVQPDPFVAHAQVPRPSAKNVGAFEEELSLDRGLTLESAPTRSTEAGACALPITSSPATRWRRGGSRRPSTVKASSWTSPAAASADTRASRKCLISRVGGNEIGEVASPPPPSRRSNALAGGSARKDGRRSSWKGNPGVNRSS